jgi:hypothetical protein
MSKQIKDKKLLPGSSRKPRSKSPIMSADDGDLKHVPASMNAPAKVLHSEDSIPSKKLFIATLDGLPAAVALVRSTSPASSSGTTVSGCSPVVDLLARNGEVVSADHRMSPKAIFDDEVLFALAAVDAVEHCRQEAAFRAILGSIST